MSLVLRLLCTRSRRNLSGSVDRNLSHGPRNTVAVISHFDFPDVLELLVLSVCCFPNDCLMTPLPPLRADSSNSISVSTIA